MRFTVKCDGLTHRQGQQIIEYLLSIPELDDLHMRFDIQASAECLASHVDHFEIWASVAAGVVGPLVAGAGKSVAEGALKKVGERVAERLDSWLRSRSKDIGSHARVSLYGPDGKLIRNLKKKSR